MEGVLRDLAAAAGGGVDLSMLEKARYAADDGLEALRTAYADLDLHDEVGLAVLILSELPSGDQMIKKADSMVAERAQELGFELSNPSGHPKFKNYQPSLLSSEIGEDADSNGDAQIVVGHCAMGSCGLCARCCTRVRSFQCWNAIGCLPTTSANSWLGASSCRP